VNYSRANRKLAFIFGFCVVTVCGAGSLLPVLLEQGKPSQKAAARGDGRQLFESTCATCHGLDGRGAERGPNIATRPAVRRLSNDEILAILRKGRPTSGMPAFGALGAANLQALLVHLRSLQGLDGNARLTGDPRKGRDLFFQKGGCAECHTVNGAGGFLGPDLSTYGAVTPFVEMRERIQHHDQSARARPVTLVTRDGRSLTGIVRNEDNFSLQLQTLDGDFHFVDRSALTNADIKISNDQAEPKITLGNDDVGALVSYLVEAAKIANANGQLKRRPVHHEEDD
jgi:putative heme-binding domain-containing protein